MKRKEYPIAFIHGWNFKEKRRNNSTYCGWNDTEDGIGGMMGRMRKETNTLLGGVSPGTRFLPWSRAR